jgi:hypothetical protein
MRPTTVVKKNDFQQSHGGKTKLKNELMCTISPFGEDLLKKDLTDIVDSERSKYDGYKIDDMAKAMGHSVLRLSLYHC